MINRLRDTRSLVECGNLLFIRQCFHKTGKPVALMSALGSERSDLCIESAT